MKISIITVAYNSAKTIRHTIESVLNQSYQDIEYVIVDGNSSDGTVEIIKEYEPVLNNRLRWISESDTGLYDAMNKGIRMATGDIVGILNSDDLFCDDQAVTNVMNIFQSHNKIDAVYADLFYVQQHDTNNIVRKWITGNQKPFRTGWHPAHPTLYIKKEVYNQFGCFDLSFKLAADFELMLRFMDKYHIKTVYLQQFLVKMRLGGETNKSIENIIKQNIECLKAFEVNGVRVNKILYPFLRVIPKLTQFTK